MRTPQPDFIIIGAMKCGTSTLHEQIARHAGTHLSDPKEPNFFSDDAEYEKGWQAYQKLFSAAKAHDLRGESSTHYTKLPTYPKTIDRMKRHLEDPPKLIYIMRHPIDRLVSHYVHDWTERKIKQPIDEAIHSHSDLIHYSQYAMQLKPFIAEFGEDQILPMFFERMITSKQEELERVCGFLEYWGEAKWHNDLGAQNQSSERMQMTLLSSFLLHFPGLRTLRNALVPKSLRNRIKSQWQMKEKPSLSEESISYLTDVFDKDLAELSEILGVELNCGNFKQVAKSDAAISIHSPVRNS